MAADQVRTEVKCSCCKTCVLVVNAAAHPTKPGKADPADVALQVTRHGWHQGKRGPVCPDCQGTPAKMRPTPQASSKRKPAKRKPAAAKRKPAKPKARAKR